MTQSTSHQSESAQAVWNFQRKVGNRLLGWSALSVLAGGLVQLRLNGRRLGAFWQAASIQALAWGAIDAAIALAGRRGAAKNEREVRDRLPLEKQLHAAEQARKLRRLLWLNAALDVGYMVGGWWFAHRFNGAQGERDRSVRGHGYGIILQGAFLFFFDVIHALRLPSPRSIN